MIKYIIFDFDGTLVDSGNVFMRIFNELSAKYGLRKLDYDEISLLRKLSVMEKCKLLEIPLYKLPSLAGEFYKAYKLALKDLLLFESILELLEELPKSGYQLAIISSNSKENIRSFFERIGFQQSFQLLSSTNIFGKDIMLKKFLKMNNLKADEVIYVGDEHRDIVACKNCGINIIWVNWGFDCLEVVELDRPNFIVTRPVEILGILQKIRQEA